MTYLIFDAVIAVLLLIALWRGYRKGFVLTLCGFLAIFVAFIGASLVSNMLAGPVSQAIRPMIESSIQQVVTDQVQTDASSSLPASEDDPSLTPDENSQDPSLEELLAELSQSKFFRGFAAAIQKSIDQGLVAATANATRIISDYIAQQIAKIVLFIVSFILILVLWYFLSHALDLAFRLPVLSTLNRWSGGILGLLKGALLVFISCQLLKGSFIPQQAIETTYLLHFFCTISPLSFFL